MRRKYGRYTVAKWEHDCLGCDRLISVGELYKQSNKNRYHKDCWERLVPTGYEKLVRLLVERGPLFSDEIPKEYKASVVFRAARMNGVPICKFAWSRGAGHTHKGAGSRFVLFYLETDKYRALRRLRDRGHSGFGKTFTTPILGKDEPQS